MRPELFIIPFINKGIPGYGLMLVLGFLAAIVLSRRICKKNNENPEHILNFAVYAMLAGVLGARLFHVFHHWSYYSEKPGEILATWDGGLEFLGGFIGALGVMIIYFRLKKLPVLKFMDILAPALMLGLAFGRMGCTLNGCCFGAPTDRPWGIRFPVTVDKSKSHFGCDKQINSEYSIPLNYQLYPDPHRHPDKPLLELPGEYYVWTDQKGRWIPDHDIDRIPESQRSEFTRYVKSPGDLTAEQLNELKTGKYRMLPIHPAQTYSMLNAFMLSLILTFLFRYRKRNGQLFAVMLILYGPTRYLIESLRCDSPLETWGLTISQTLGILSFFGGIIMLAALQAIKSTKLPPSP
ncbi:MAG: prolipoprotein diacylglyceryl transferase [Phycisphaerae bacterium]|nr:prolipoprotein diacylglyceryl transferase [Phycisphaerae bacterium]